MSPSNCLRFANIPLTLVGILLALLVTFWVYGPGISGPLLLDDRTSLDRLVNFDGSYEDGLDYVFGDKSGPLGRPVSIASFVFEMAIFNRGLSSGKLVNVAIHSLNGALLFLFLSLLLRHAGVRRLQGSLIALLLIFVWLSWPIHVSTVLYLVQRMAMLSATGMLLACISYCILRRQVSFNRKAVFWTIVFFFSCLFAVLAKENAMVLVLVVPLLEVGWFRFRGVSGNIQPRVLLAFQCYLALVTIALFFFAAFMLEGHLGGYAFRDFSLEERTLSEGRILWHYLSQVLWPDIHYLGLYHDDFPVSTSLWEPWSTAAALLAWGLTITLCLIALMWESPARVACGMLMFLAAHSLESTIFPLELYFEHRNYFPTVGIVVFMAGIFSFLNKEAPSAIMPASVLVAIYAVLQWFSTSSQVQIWSDINLFNIDSVNSHPESFRANAGMANHLATVGDLDGALSFSARASKLSNHERPSDAVMRELAVYCLARSKPPDSLIASFGRKSPDRPLASAANLIAFTKATQSNTCENFPLRSFLDRVFGVYEQSSSNSFASFNVFLMFSSLENYVENWENALAYVQHALELRPDDPQALLMKLHYLANLGREYEVNVLLSKLHLMVDSGRLTSQQIQILNLYGGA